MIVNMVNDTGKQSPIGCLTWLVNGAGLGLDPS